MHTLGRHLIAEYYGCDLELLNQVEAIRQIMLAAAVHVEATPVGDCFHQFAPQGVSGSVIIAESHLSIHTWPQNGYVSVDVYTCGGLDPQPAFEFIGKKLGADEGRYQEILRGLASDLIHADQQLQSSDVSIISEQQSLLKLK